MTNLSCIKNRRGFLFLLFFAMAALALPSCSEDCQVCPTNQAPTVPADPTPGDQTTDVSILTSLSWDASDPEGECLSYDIYCGTDTALVHSHHHETSCSLPDELLFDTTYYWKVVAKDAGKETSGPVWSFTTETGNTIGVFRDPSGTNCDLPVDVNIYELYVVLLGETDAKKVRFRAPVPGCAGASYLWLGDTPMGHSIVGNSQAGMEVDFGGACVTGPTALVKVAFFVMGPTVPCCFYGVLPHPSDLSGEIEMTDCNDDVRFITSSSSFINSDASCSCTATSVSENTWGKIKGLSKR